MKTFLAVFFSALLLTMLAAIVQASFARSVFQAGRGLWPDPWFVATLLEAYLGFLIFFVWVAYKERSAFSRILWFVLIMGLGNMAAALYVLLQLRKMGPGENWERLLLRAGSEAEARTPRKEERR